mgnify:CR=1 FL=1
MNDQKSPDEKDQGHHSLTANNHGNAFTSFLLILIKLIGALLGIGVLLFIAFFIICLGIA